jgi:hypothetical protein
MLGPLFCESNEKRHMAMVVFLIFGKQVIIKCRLTFFSSMVHKCSNFCFVCDISVQIFLNRKNYHGFNHGLQLCMVHKWSPLIGKVISTLVSK